MFRFAVLGVSVTEPLGAAIIAEVLNVIVSACSSTFPELEVMAAGFVMVPQSIVIDDWAVKTPDELPPKEPVPHE